MTTLPVTLDDVQKADTRIQPYIVRTPLQESPQLNRALGFRLLVKAECLQVTKAFKIRGALNNILQLTADEKKRGVVAGSAGNHAKGLALAAQMFGVPATLIMPDDAPQIKISDTIACGAKVEFCKRNGENRDAVVQRYADQHGLTIIHSYDRLGTIAGQGTIGLEIHQQCSAMGIEPDALIVNCSGGGLASGIALSRALYNKAPQFYTAEPQGFDDARRSFATGMLQGNSKTSGSICDALLLQLCPLTFSILDHHNTKGLTTNDTGVKMAMSVAADMFNLTLEPGGAAGLATAILKRDKFKGQTVVVVASGGNVDSEKLPDYMRVGAARRRQIPGLDL